MHLDTTRPSLLARVRDPADQGAWREFDARYGELILRTCGRAGLKHADAEDVRQAVMIRLARALQQFEYSPQKGRFRGYLGTIVRNEIARHFGSPVSQSAQVTRDERILASHQEVPSDADWEAEWMHHHLRLAMRRIRQTFEPQSVAVFEQLLDGATPAAVADSLGMSPDAVRKVKERIRQRLMELVAAQIQDEDEPPWNRHPHPQPRTPTIS